MHPMQRQCPADDPSKFAAWAWAAGIPDPSPARPMPIPLISPQLVGGVSKMLWDFGFRHHPELQTKWIKGAAGLGMIAEIVDKEPVDPFMAAAEEFLGEENPQLLDAIRKAPEAERLKLLTQLEENFAQMSGLIETLKNVPKE